MATEMTQGKRDGFGQDEQAKAEKLARLRQRLAAATPPTKKPVWRYQWDWRRSAQAAALIAILVLAVVAGSGIF